MPDFSTKPNEQASPGELNLAQPGDDKPRLKKRSLKGKVTSAQPSSRTETPEIVPDAPRAEPVKTEPVLVEAQKSAATSVPAPKPAASNPFYPPQASTTSLNSTPLYYTTGVRKEKEDASPMKTSPASSPYQARPTTAAATPQSRPAATPATPTSRPANGPSASAYQSPRPTAAASSPAASSSTAAGSSSQARSNPAPSPANGSASGTAQTRAATTNPGSSASSASTTSPGPTPASTPNASAGTSTAKAAAASSLSPTVSLPSRSASVNDYRANVERQSREQKSVGNVISLVVYTLAGLFIIGALLAGYGAYAISKQIHQQSLTMSDLDNRSRAENEALSAQLKASNDSLTQSLTQTQTQLNHQQDLLVQQQDSLNKLTTLEDANSAAWRQERLARAAETATLRTRVRNLEDQPHFGPATRQ